MKISQVKKLASEAGISYSRNAGSNWPYIYDLERFAEVAKDARPRNAIAQSIHDYALSSKNIANIPSAEKCVCIAMCGIMDSVYFGRNDKRMQSRVFCLIVAAALS